MKETTKPYFISTIKKGLISKNPGWLKKLIEFGTTTFRFNLSRHTEQSYIDEILLAKQIIKSMKSSSQVEIMIDLPLPMSKIRLGTFKKDTLFVKSGQALLFRSANYSDDITKFIPIDYLEVGKSVYENQEIPIGNGDLIIKVKKILNSSEFQAIPIIDGFITSSKGIYFGNTFNILDDNEKKIKIYVNIIKKLLPQQIALSFVENIDQIIKIKEIFRRELGDYNPQIISKIESLSGIKNIQNIIDESDKIMIARGDLLLMAQPEYLGFYQKLIINKCKSKKKDVIVATNILASYYDRLIPTQSDIIDLTQLILDGIDGFVFSGELCSMPRAEKMFNFAKRVIQLKYNDFQNI